MSNQESEFNEIKQRLDEIVDLVSDENIDLDEALSLYEEAVKLGIAACDSSEFLSEDDEHQVEGIDSKNRDSENSGPEEKPSDNLGSEEGHAENSVSEEGHTENLPAVEESFDAAGSEGELSKGQSAPYSAEKEV